MSVDRFFKWQAVLPIMTPVLLIGGMTTGMFTPTEGAIAASVWAVVLGLFWYRTLSWKMFVKVSLDSVETTATIMFVVAAASIFGWMLTATGVTTAIAQWVLGFTKEAWVFLLLANLLMLFVGCFLEPTAAITILVPLLLPIATQLGVDPVHFGLVMVLNLMIGLLHPPMGMVLFVLARVAKLSVERTTVAILPWLVPLLLSLVLLTYVPAIGAVAAAHAGLVTKGRRMTRIAAIDLLHVDLPPPVPRSDAIQSFVTQETPFVRVVCDDGSEGIGYSYTIGTGGSSVMALLRDHLAPRLIGRDPAQIEAIWRELMFSTHATSVGAITSLALAAIDTALWDWRCRRDGQPLWLRGRWREAAHPGLHDRRRLAAPVARRPGARDRWRRRRPASRAPSSRSASRMSARTWRD